MGVALLEQQMNQTRGSRNQHLQVQLAKSTRDPRHCRKALAKADLGGDSDRLESSPKNYSFVFLHLYNPADGKELHLEINQNHE